MKKWTDYFPNESGGPAAEFALVLPIALLFFFGIIDVGRYLWEYNQAEKATQSGARYAVATNFIPGGTGTNGLYSHSFAATGAVAQGSTVPASAFPGVRCVSNGNSASCACKGSCAFDVTGDNAAFVALVNRMKAFKTEIGAANVVINYDYSGLGYSGDPGGADVAPLVTVGLRNLNFVPITTMLFNTSITMAGNSTSTDNPLGHISYALTMEDGAGAVSN